MISVLEESQSRLPGACRFYDSDFHKSEVTGTHTHCRATGVLLCVFQELVGASGGKMNEFKTFWQQLHVIFVFFDADHRANWGDLF